MGPGIRTGRGQSTSGRGNSWGTRFAAPALDVAVVDWAAPVAWSARLRYNERVPGVRRVAPAGLKSGRRRPPSPTFDGRLRPGLAER